MNNVLAEVMAAADNARAVIAPKVGGLTSFRIRNMLNTLAAKLPPEEAYLEIGVHIGGTLISALINNKKVTAYACDNWEFATCIQGKPKDVFFQNIEQYKPFLPKIDVLDMDCWKLLANPPFTKKIGAYFYDAGYEEEDQYKALLLAYPYLADRCMMIVDDFGWKKVQKGTWRAVAELGFKKVQFDSRIPPKDEDVDWHNGIGVFYFEK